MRDSFIYKKLLCVFYWKEMTLRSFHDFCHADFMGFLDVMTIRAPEHLQVSNLSEYPKFHFKNRLKFTGNVLYIYDGFYDYHYDV